jgi:hypothetical protein
MKVPAFFMAVIGMIKCFKKNERIHPNVTYVTEFGIQML